MSAFCVLIKATVPCQQYVVSTNPVKSFKAQMFQLFSSHEGSVTFVNVEHEGSLKSHKHMQADSCGAGNLFTCI